MQMIQGNKNKYKLTDAYLNVLINSWLNVNINNYSPNYFKQVISDMNPLFQGIQANDSKDLIIFLLETMHKELNEAKINIIHLSKNFGLSILFEYLFQFYFSKI
jgi:ubiquitin C-terminal hydrolase